MVQSVQLLGPLTVEIDGNRISHFRSQKTLALLAYLIVEDRHVARDFLAELFWPDNTSAAARGHLRRALYDLTHKLPGWITFEHDVVAFNHDAQIYVDLRQFDSLSSANDSNYLERAYELSRGEFLEGMSMLDCPQFEHWLWSERERWRQKVVSVIETLCGRYSEMSRHDRALDCTWKLLKLQPWREERYRDLMVMLVRNGDLATALKVYARCRRVLANELEMEPAADTLALHNRIRKLIGQTAPNVVVEVFPQRSWTWELDSLIRNLTDPGHRLITITGPDSSGRQSLATNAMGRVNGRSGYFFIDGVCLVRLKNNVTSEETTAHLSYGLRITTPRKTVPLSFILKYLQDKELLLLLTDLEVSEEHRKVLSAILVAAPAVKIIVTAFDSFHLPDEVVIALDPLGGAHTNDKFTPEDGEVDPHEHLGLFL